MLLPFLERNIYIDSDPPLREIVLFWSCGKKPFPQFFVQNFDLKSNYLPPKPASTAPPLSSPQGGRNPIPTCDRT